MIQVDNFDSCSPREIARGLTERCRRPARASNTGPRKRGRIRLHGEDGQLAKSSAGYTKRPRLRLQGFHCHVGTFILTRSVLPPCRAQARRASRRSRGTWASGRSATSTRGGFASNARLHYQYCRRRQLTPSFDRLAESHLRHHHELCPLADAAEAYLETGRALVDDAAPPFPPSSRWKERQIPRKSGSAFAAYGKGGAGDRRAPASRTALVLDAGVNILYTTAWYQPENPAGAAMPRPPAATTVTLPLHEHSTSSARIAPLPGLTTGDRVVIHPVGAYNVHAIDAIITLPPAVVLIERRESARHQESRKPRVCAGLETVPDYWRYNRELPKRARRRRRVCAHPPARSASRVRRLFFFGKRRLAGGCWHHSAPPDLALRACRCVRGGLPRVGLGYDAGISARLLLSIRCSSASTLDICTGAIISDAPVYLLLWGASLAGASFLSAADDIGWESPIPAFPPQSLGPPFSAAYVLYFSRLRPCFGRPRFPRGSKQRARSPLSARLEAIFQAFRRDAVSAAASCGVARFRGLALTSPA